MSQSREGLSRALTLDEVIDLAEARSEQIAIAQFGVDRAAAGVQRARGERMPQISGGDFLITSLTCTLG